MHRFFERLFLASLGLGMFCSSPPSAHAEPTAPSILCSSYPEFSECVGKVPACALCHDSTDPPSWNAFGTAVKGALPEGADFATALPAALAAIENEDADGDGVTNLEELLRGSSPGVADAASAGDQGSVENPRYRVGQYDPSFAFRRVSALYCGRSPNYDELNAFQEGNPDDATLIQRIHDKLQSCLKSDYWLTEGLMRLADTRIKPVKAFGNDTAIVIGDVRIVIGDYDYDYNLWRYALSDDHDMREMLTAQYHVVKNADGTLEKVSGVIEKPDPNAVAGGQPVPPEERAGLLTTQYFLAYQTMFSPIPRVTAAQAYRAYLGADIANQEGLRPVQGEPSDVDRRGVAQPRCAVCHSTLDPLSYAFADYEGVLLSLSTPFGSYAPDRPARLVPDWNVTDTQSVLLGQPVANLVEWGKVASESDEFKRNIADMFFHHALGRAPTPDELDEFNGMWQMAEQDGYSANRMLQRLVDTLAFGSP